MKGKVTSVWEDLVKWNYRENIIEKFEEKGREDSKKDHWLDVIEAPSGVEGSNKVNDESVITTGLTKEIKYKKKLRLNYMD